jgi:SAM-dependent methyltransferase
VAHAVSVWVIQAVAEPERLFSEVARVLRPAGRYVVCTTQRPGGDDVIGQIIERMAAAIDERRGGRPRAVTADEVLEWSAPAGLVGEPTSFDRSFTSTAALEIDAIAGRAWPALRSLDEGDIEEVTGPAIEALRSLPEGELQRRMTAEMVVLQRPQKAR